MEALSGVGVIRQVLEEGCAEELAESCPSRTSAMEQFAPGQVRFCAGKELHLACDRFRMSLRRIRLAA